ncbi:MAG: cobalamin B12-binding domain-containing protein [Deltaproteobacteria bacterium]
MTKADTPLISSIKSLQSSPADMRRILEELSQVLRADKSWSRAEIFRAGEILFDRKKASPVKDLWHSPPTMMTTTLDDAIGQGLQIIHLFGRLAGVDVKPLGLMQSPEDIISSCRQQMPDILGLTILQFHSEETLCEIIANLPSHIQVIVGGPIFRSMGLEKLDAKDYLVLKDIKHFIDYLLTYNDSR